MDYQEFLGRALFYAFVLLMVCSALMLFIVSRLRRRRFRDANQFHPFASRRYGIVDSNAHSVYKYRVCLGFESLPEAEAALAVVNQFPKVTR